MNDITEPYVFNPDDLTVTLTVRVANADKLRELAEAEIWKMYEREKAHLEQMDLTPTEYERAVRDLARRLGV